MDDRDGNARLVVAFLDLEREHSPTSAMKGVRVLTGLPNEIRGAGKVRAGMTPRIRKDLFDLLTQVATKKCPFANLPNSKSSLWGTGVIAEEMLEMTWLKTGGVVQIRFVEWTAEGNLRHAAFIAARARQGAQDGSSRNVIYLPLGSQSAGSSNTKAVKSQWEKITSSD